ncbi:ankyrin repeat protein [Mucilaginibacter gracilis]|uniref:Ankyrin repeat protein n=1 Tax=Mucilaginibacter gracilis TaxID=423350 RepID=A0A495JA76_9SPHI|nr:ankyrin repeat domain-containing protein [Mucilaginibacter gracilis]RKR85611.1 ankyrin repeat protein [Mucilaginibacter gracilis]
MIKGKKTVKLPNEIVKSIYVNNIAVINSWVNTLNIDLVDNNDRTMLFHAIIAGFDDLVALLLESKANIDLKDNKGWSPLHYAVQNSKFVVVGLLIEKGANVETKDDYGNTALWRAVFASKGNGEIIKLLLAKGANPDNENDSGISPLGLANKIANYNIVQFFD